MNGIFGLAAREMERNCQKGQILPTRINNRLIQQQNGNAIWRRESARKGLKSTSGAQYWSSQLFDLRAQSYTDVAVQLLNQPNNMRVTTSQMKQTFDRHMLLMFDQQSESGAPSAGEQGFQNPRVCLLVSVSVSSFSSPVPPLSSFGTRSISRADKTENPVFLRVLCSETKGKRLQRRLF